MTDLSRRHVITGAAAVGAATLLSPGSATAGGTAGTSRTFAELERRHDRRIGVYARNLRTGRELAHRPDERFAMCSTFKTLAVGAVLAGRLVTPDPKVLTRRAYWPPSLVAGAGYAPVMQGWQDAGYSPTMAEVCEAAQADSDNAAANLILQQVGGPDAITRFARTLGDRVTTLTRWEPDLNEWRPGQEADATTPRAMGRSHASLLVGDALPGRQRRRLAEWMLANRTGDDALRAGLPAGWTIAEKTGSAVFGTRNDVGVAWTPRGVPVLISCLTRADEADTPTIDEPLADVARLCARELG